MSASDLSRRMQAEFAMLAWQASPPRKGKGGLPVAAAAVAHPLLSKKPSAEEAKRLAKKESVRCCHSSPPAPPANRQLNASSLSSQERLGAMDALVGTGPMSSDTLLDWIEEINRILVRQALFFLLTLLLR